MAAKSLKIIILDGNNVYYEARIQLSTGVFGRKQYA